MEEILKEAVVDSESNITIRLVKVIIDEKVSHYAVAFYINGEVHGHPIRSSEYNRISSYYNNVALLC